MVLNSLSIDPEKTWKGVWRWWSEENLECAPLESISKGTTFDEIHQVALCNGLSVIAKRFDQTSYQEFLSDVKRIAGGHEEHMVVSFSREALGQTGDGHFSPIGGYAPQYDKILILDTARFKYPSYFVDSKKLFEAMKPVDKETGLSRGYLIFSKYQHEKTLPLCRINLSNSQLEFLRRLFSEYSNLYSADLNENLIKNLISAIFSSYPNFFIHFDSNGKDLAASSEQHVELENAIEKELKKFYQEITLHHLFKEVSQSIQMPKENTLAATIFILSLPRQLFSTFHGQYAEKILHFQDINSFPIDSRLLIEEITR